jgi:3',5'-cyclic-AMP phosphodiesterase
MDRRDFLTAAAGLGAVAVSAKFSCAAMRRVDQNVKIGLIADLHQDIMHDGPKRMKAFVDQMGTVKPDALLQLGDFAYPNEKNKAVIDPFNGAHPTTLHVIGNHDTDDGHTKQQCIDVWGMPDRYYAKNINGLSLLVLDANETGSPTHKGGYPCFVGDEQVQWLKHQLVKTEGPIIVVSHQPLAGPHSVDNAEQIQAILGEFNDKVILALCGHTHIDCLLRANGIPYLHINSASYKWVGAKYKHASYDNAVHEKYPSIAYTCPYEDSLFATLELDSQSQTISITGCRSQWVGKSPEQLGEDPGPTLVPGEQIAPRIRNRTITRVSR